MQLQLICGVEEHEVPAVEGVHAIVALLPTSRRVSVPVSQLSYIGCILLLFLRRLLRSSALA